MTQSAYVLIPVHNRKATTLRCLDHLQRTGVMDEARIVVIDDGSTDGTGEAVATRFPEAHILRGDGDLWWTGAIVAGMRHVLAQGAQIIFWLNDDCLPDIGTFAAMTRYMAENPNSLVAPACYLEGQPDEWLATGFIGRRLITPRRGEATPVGGLSGFCVGMPTEVCRKIGLPDAKSFPHYAGDGMYIMAAVRAGFQAVLLGSCAAALPDYDAGSVKFSALAKQEVNFWDVAQAVFLRKKSRYFLRTLFYYCRAKYGWVLGAGLFVMRACQWFTQFCAEWVRRPRK